MELWTFILIVRKEYGSRVASTTSWAKSFLLMLGGANSSEIVSTSVADPSKKWIKLAWRRHTRGTFLKCWVQIKVVQLTCLTW